MGSHPKTNRNTRLGLLLPWVLLTLPIVAIFVSARELPSALHAADKPQIRIALNHWPGFEVLYLAQELGLYAQEGADVRIVELASLADSARALVQGDADAIACTPVEAILAQEHGGKRVSIVYVFDSSCGGDVILARNDIHSISALKGRRIAIEPTSLTTVVLHEALRRVGLSIRDVEIVSMDPLNMPEAMVSGSVDAAVCYPPVSLRILESTNATTLFSSADIPDLILDVLALDRALLESRPHEVHAILRAVRRAAEIAESNPDLADPIMAAREGLTVGQFRAARASGLRPYTADDQPHLLARSGPLDRAIHATREALRAARGASWANAYNSLPEVVSLRAEQPR
ncbi:MAG: ABC transporter substrate-binding protein [Phycisphaerales bacterium]